MGRRLVLCSAMRTAHNLVWTRELHLERLKGRLKAGQKALCLVPLMAMRWVRSSVVRTEGSTEHRLGGKKVRP